MEPETFENKFFRYLELSKYTFAELCREYGAKYPTIVNAVRLYIDSHYDNYLKAMLERLTPIKDIAIERDFLTVISEVRKDFGYAIDHRMTPLQIAELGNQINAELKIQLDDSTADDLKEALLLQRRFQAELEARDEEEAKNLHAAVNYEAPDINEFYDNNNSPKKSAPLKLKLSELLRESKSCSICLEAYNDKDELVILHCRHAFHDACLQNWNKQTCPQCRQ
jgi:hypothetical protein